MALKDLWGRLTGREPAPAGAAAEPAVAEAPLSSALEPVAEDADLLILPPEVEALLLREVEAEDAPYRALRGGDPVPEPPPVQEPPHPIPVPPDEDEPEVEEPPPADIPDLPPAEEPGTPPPIQDPPAQAGAGVPVSGGAFPPGTPGLAGAPPVVPPVVPPSGLAAASPEPLALPSDFLIEPEPEPAARPELPILASAPVAAPAPATGFFGRLKAGLQRSTQRLTEGLTGLFVKRKLDDAALEDLEDTLVAADLGVAAARRIVGEFRRTRFGREVSDEEVRGALAEEIAAILTPVARPLVPAPGARPYVVLMVGVNGTGKTTTIAKLSEQWRAEGRRVMLAAGDTFRAAAVEQLQVWGDRTGAPVVVPAKPGADAAGLAHEALDRAVAEGMDILLVDTAGRLHNKAGLMEELRKVVRVLKRKDPAVPHATILVLDATTGQNAIQQCKVFQEMVDITGLVVTKLDGSAKGGVVVALAQEFGLPVHAVGVGEKAADLRPFDPRDFARSLVGLA